MSAREFDFALQLSDAAAADEMLSELVRSVLDQVGYGREVVDDCVARLAGVCAAAPRHAPCWMRIRAEGGELQIEIGSGDREWHTRRPLPSVR